MTSLLTPERVTKRVPVKEPAKLWRTKWRVLKSFRDEAGTFHKKGKTGFLRHTHPSRELADQWAADFIAANIAKYGCCLSEYLGAFPVDAP